MEIEDQKFFRGDQVSSTTGCLKYGLVYRIEPNKIGVKWYPSGQQELISDEKVVLKSRTFHHGSTVRRVGDSKQSQLGYCTNFNIYATVKILNTNKIVENIRLENLIYTKPLDVNSVVFYESWVGQVFVVSYQITFCTPDGSVFTMHDPNRLQFISCSKSDSFSAYKDLYYSGQKLKIRLKDLKKEKFIYTNELMDCLLKIEEKSRLFKWIIVHVMTVSLVAVEVNWKCKALSTTIQCENDYPDNLIFGEKLKKLIVLDLFNPRHINIGDTYWYLINNNDNMITVKEFAKDIDTQLKPLPNELKKKGHLRKLLGIPKRKIPVKNKQKMKKRGIRKYITQSKSSKNKSYSSIFQLNRLKTYCMRELLVAKRILIKMCKVSVEPNSSVIVKAIYFKHIVDVLWQDGTIETGISSTDLYPIKNYDFENFPGDFVRETKPSSNDYGVIESVDRVRRTACVQWFKNNPENLSLPNPTEKTNSSLYDLCEHPEYNFRYESVIMRIDYNTGTDTNVSKYGIVKSCWPSGKILVEWENGVRTLCVPQELFSIDDQFNANNINIDLSTDTKGLESPTHLTTEKEQSQDQVEKIIIKLSLINGKGDVSEMHIHTNQIDLCRKLMADHMCIEDEGNGGNNIINMDIKEIEKTSVIPLIKQESTASELIAQPEEAGVFELMETLLDNSHKYVAIESDMDSLTLKKIFQDIQVLKRSLPSGIWVKTFENRMDLFSVMIRGPEKTPYAGGLFMFDLKIPTGYPLNPPLCHYYSFCNDRLNPNLYEDGKVCLSLLGTWHGEGSEVWVPFKSNLLQILVSIQGLILVNEPYYNEPGNETELGQKMFKEHSRVYNEMTLIKVVESMANILAMIKNSTTPQYFIKEIEEHVKYHGPKLIKTIKNWIKISENELTEDDKLDPGYPLLPLSKGFCLSVNKALQEYNKLLASMNIIIN